MDPSLERFLAEHAIAHVLHRHPAVFTVDEAALHCPHIPGLSCKNLFVKDDKGVFYLVVLPAAKRLDMHAFRRTVGAGKTRFASGEELLSILRLTPGAVSPFGLVNDTERKVAVYIDREVWDASVVSFHPNINTETLELHQGEFRKLFGATGHSPNIL